MDIRSPHHRARRWPHHRARRWPAWLAGGALALLALPAFAADAPREPLGRPGQPRVVAPAGVVTTPGARSATRTTPFSDALLRRALERERPGEKPEQGTPVPPARARR